MHKEEGQSYAQVSGGGVEKRHRFVLNVRRPLGPELQGRQGGGAEGCGQSLGDGGISENPAYGLRLSGGKRGEVPRSILSLLLQFPGPLSAPPLPSS